MNKKEERKAKLLDLYNSGLKNNEIARKLDVSEATVYNYIKELKDEGKIEKRKKTVNRARSRVREKNKEETLKLYNLGLKNKEIAEKLEVSETTISTYIKELKEEGVINKRKKTSNRAGSRIKEKNKEETLKLYKLGLKQREIAEKLEVSIATVNIYIRELKEEGKIKRKNKSAENLNDIDKRLDKEEFTQKDYNKFSEYILDCKERLANKTLKKEELITLKKLMDLIYRYEYVLFYIKACIRLGEIAEAKKEANKARTSQEFSVEQKKKFSELAGKIVQIDKERTAIIMLKKGRSVKEVAKYSGLLETEVVKLNRKLLEKRKKAKAEESIGENR